VPIRHLYDPEEQLSLWCQQDSDVIPLHVAENVLLFENHLKPLFERTCTTELADTKYQPNYGRDDLNGAVGAFLSKSLGWDPALTHREISSFAGTRSAVDVMGRALFEGYADRPGGSSVLMPSPRWHGFAWTYEARLGGSIVDIPLTAEGGFRLTLKAIQDAYGAADPKPRALVLTQPENPLGVHYDRAFLESAAQWVLEKTDMDLVSDEIYAHCVVPGASGPAFTSALALPQAVEHPDRVHVVWGFAKDFGLSGFRVGVLASRSKKLHDVVRPVTSAGFSPMTSSNAWFVRKLFHTRGVAEGLMKEVLPRELKQSFDAASDALEEQRIPRFGGTHSAQFFWLDLRQWLDRRIPTVHCPNDPEEDFGDPREQALERYLRCGAKVSLLRGQRLAASDIGFFRLCYTAVDRGTVVQAIRRVGTALRAIPR
jgi:aspartate/methionine/tyrosine aminotransferase